MGTLKNLKGGFDKGSIISEFSNMLIFLGNLECRRRKIFAKFALPIVKGIVLDILLAAIFCGSKPAILFGKDDLFPGC